jgi:integrase
LRDYVLILANTGMRHGTEAMNLKWRHIEWFINRKGRRAKGLNCPSATSLIMNRKPDKVA